MKKYIVANLKMNKNFDQFENISQSLRSEICRFLITR